MTGVLRDRLQVHGNPVRMFFSAGPWRATAYLANYIVIGSVLFSVAVTVVVTSYALSIIWLGLPLLVGAAWIVRGAAHIERNRLRSVADQIPDPYRPITKSGLFAQVKTLWTDPAILRDCGYLILMYPPLLIVDTLVLGIWLGFLGGIALPLWYWSIPHTWPNGVREHGAMIGYFPNGPNGEGAIGFWIGDLPTALIAAAVFFLLSLLGAYLIVATARLHRNVARSLLGPHIDPLAAAKRMLIEPGPLIP